MNIYNFDKINFLLKMLLHAKIIIILNYKKNFVRNSLVIKTKFQLFKILE